MLTALALFGCALLVDCVIFIFGDMNCGTKRTLKQ